MLTNVVAIWVGGSIPVHDRRLHLLRWRRMMLLLSRRRQMHELLAGVVV